MFRARSALPYLPIYRSASVGRSLAGRPAGAGLLANVIRDRLGRLAAGWGQPPAAASSLQLFYNKKRTVFNKRVRPLCRNQHAKIFPCAALPSLSRTMLKKRWKGKFWCGQNLPLVKTNPF